MDLLLKSFNFQSFIRSALISTLYTLYTMLPHLKYHVTKVAELVEYKMLHNRNVKWMHIEC